MNIQTKALLERLASVAIPNHVHDLLAAYDDHGDPKKALKLHLFAEPYYGDFNKCNLVFLTHNPGGSYNLAKGLHSPFNLRIDSPPSFAREINYFGIASANSFPNTKTNKWTERLNQDVTNLFLGVTTFQEKLFIRDLIPYHSDSFGTINMASCTDYLYSYFFNQVFEASLNSELYHKLNANSSKPAIVIFARGSAWKSPTGLSSVGWDLVGRLYANCYIFKANPSKINKIEGFDIKKYPSSVFDHDIFIVVLTQIRPGAKLGIYLNNNAPLVPVSISGIINNGENLHDLFCKLLSLLKP